MRLTAWLGLAAICLLLGGAALAITDPSSGTHLVRSSGAPAKSYATRSAPLPAVRMASAISRLSLEQLAGQRIIYAYPGLTPPTSLLTRIRRAEAAGVILFAPNIASRGQIRKVVAELQRAAKASVLHAPILVMADQEGGLVRRLSGAPFLSEKQIGGNPDGPSLATREGRAAGLNLASVGINVNLAPVLDVYRQPGNFIDSYERSFSMSPRDVAQLGSAFIAAQQQTGVAATAKHFPGLGTAIASQNTDEATVTLPVSLRELRTIDERPYAAAIPVGVDLVMASWAVYPALDPDRPAGLSRVIIQGELRKRLGFRGVTITDSLGAAALENYGTYANRGALAARAGADLILCSAQQVGDNSPVEGEAVLGSLTRELEIDGESRPTAETAAASVLRLRLHP